jgi:hypothetical protein
MLSTVVTHLTKGNRLAALQARNFLVSFQAGFGLKKTVRKLFDEELYVICVGFH